MSNCTLWFSFVSSIKIELGGGHTLQLSLPCPLIQITQNLRIETVKYFDIERMHRFNNLKPYRHVWKWWISLILQCTSEEIGHNSAGCTSVVCVLIDGDDGSCLPLKPQWVELKWEDDSFNSCELSNCSEYTQDWFIWFVINSCECCPSGRVFWGAASQNWSNSRRFEENNCVSPEHSFLCWQTCPRAQIWSIERAMVQPPDIPDAQLSHQFECIIQ